MTDLSSPNDFSSESEVSPTGPGGRNREKQIRHTAIRMMMKIKWQKSALTALRIAYLIEALGYSSFDARKKAFERWGIRRETARDLYKQYLIKRKFAAHGVKPEEILKRNGNHNFLSGGKI